MQQLLAHIIEPAERRRMHRRTLRLDIAAQSATAEAVVAIRNLSRTGLLIETEAGFDVGETFILVLPDVGATPARVVRGDGRIFGCEFLSPIPASAISAALLKAAPAAGTDAALAGTGVRNDEQPFTPRPFHALLFAAVTAAFTAAALLFVVALASLTFS